MQLRDYQAQTVDWSLDWLDKAKPGDRKLFAAPTGTGKSLIELEILKRHPGAWLVTPSLTIISGFLDKLGLDTASMSEARFISAAWERRIATPVRLRNALLAGEVASPPTCLLFDESHHDLASSWQDIHPLCGYAPAIGFTASPYRGTPRGTAAFRQQWGEPFWVITYKQAMQRGYISMPRCEVVPLVDDDEIKVVAGELAINEVEQVLMSRLEAVTQLVLSNNYFAFPASEIPGIHGGYTVNGEWDTPTMFSVPTRETAIFLVQHLQFAGIPACVVTAESSQTQRQGAFRDCLNRSAALVQINVVSEGVDLPIRRLIDLSPTLSPVKWIQQIGRIMRPGGVSEYLCTNRNLMRHGYLLDGCLPPSTFAESVAAFGGVGKRAAVRAFGLEGLGKFKATEIPCQEGVTALGYSIARIEGHRTTQYFAIVHPARAQVVWASRGISAIEGATKSYERWVRCDEPGDDFRGFKSLPTSPLSEKQEAWWKKSAKTHGLDAEAKINNRVFQVLPVLSDLRCKL